MLIRTTDVPSSVKSFSVLDLKMDVVLTSMFVLLMLNPHSYYLSKPRILLKQFLRYQDHTYKQKMPNQRRWRRTKNIHEPSSLKVHQKTPFSCHSQANRDILQRCHTMSYPHATHEIPTSTSLKNHFANKQEITDASVPSPFRRPLMPFQAPCKRPGLCTRRSKIRIDHRSQPAGIWTKSRRRPSRSRQGSTQSSRGDFEG